PRNRRAATSRAPRARPRRPLGRAVPIAANGSSFSQQLPDLSLILMLVTGLVAVMDVTHLALAIDDHGRRHRDDSIQTADLVRRIEQHGEADRRFFQKLLDASRVVLDVDAEQREAEILVALMKRLEMRHLLAARPAPCRPEVDQHDVAREILERY